MPQLVDSNVWLALTISGHAFHIAAETWFDGLRSQESAAFCRATQQSLLRLLTTAAVFAPYATPALSNKSAWSVYHSLADDRHVTWIDEPQGIETYWKRFASSSKAPPKLWMDAYLAAFAIAGEHQFVTTDHAFQQFKGLDLVLLT